MSRPNNSIGHIKLPGDTDQRPIVPTQVTDGTNVLVCPTLPQDGEIVGAFSKTYTGLIGTTAAYKNASFYLVNIKPDS